MWFITKLSSNKRGVGSILGAAFLLLILLSGFASYTLYVKRVSEYTKILQDMQQLDLQRDKAKIEFISVSFTSEDELNITVKNTGSYHVHLIWLGIFDEAANTQDYYKINFYISPAETEPDIGNNTISTFEGQPHVIQLVTELGNTFSYSYPESSEGDSGEERFDWVDEVCDLHPPSARGTHNFFSAQQYGPDGIVDTLIEESTAGVTNTTLINQESFEGTWPPTGWIANPPVNGWAKVGSEAFDGTFSASVQGSGGGRSGDLDTPDLDCSDANAVYVDFWYRDEGCEATEFLLQYYDGTSWDTIADLGSTASEHQWLHYQEKVADSQYFKSNFKLRWSAVDVDNGERVYVDLVTVKKEVDVNYELDLEVRWIEADYDEANEWLCIYGGEMGSEDVLVDVWSGSDWITVLEDLESGWNSVDISSYLVSSTLKIRFKGGTETGDYTQNSWEIDATFLHVWT